MEAVPRGSGLPISPPNPHERMGVSEGRDDGLFIFLKNFTSFYLFIFWLCSMQDLSSQPGLEPVAPAVESTEP